MSESLINMSLAHRAEFGWPGGDTPGALGFSHEVSPPLRAAIVKVVAAHLSAVSEAASVHALTPPDGAVSRYRVQAGPVSVFVRVSRRWGEPEREQAITGYLKSCGCSVNHLEVAGASLEFDGEIYRVDVRDLVEGRHFDGSPSDLRSLAGELAKCHAALRHFPKAAAVREHATRRYACLDETRRQMREALDRRDWTFFADDPQWALGHAEWLQTLVEQFEPDFERQPSAQCLHAQIHRANVLYRRADSSPVLVDWEEAVHTFAPVSWDLAYFLQRFCLHDDPERSIARERLVVVRAAYGAWTPGIADMMRQLAWLSIVIIVGNRQARAFSNPTGEYEKFVRLERQAWELRSLIDGDLLAS
jgi:hypothetical protein